MLQNLTVDYFETCSKAWSFL